MGDVVMTRVASAENIADPFTKVLPQKMFEKHFRVYEHAICV
jgi:hypothetical protein